MPCRNLFSRWNKPKQISFSSMHESHGYADGTFRCRVTVGRKTEEIHYSVPDGFQAHNDTIATTLSCLCGNKFSSISFNFPISDYCKAGIEKAGKCEVQATGQVEQRPAGSNAALSFSGGYDSLAAWLLAPDYYHRVAVDWGRGFERERRWFETLKPEIIVQSNVRALGYSRIDWRFMGSAACLLSDHFDFGEISFGAILEARAANMKAANPIGPSTWHWAAIGLRDSSPTRGLNQLGTALLVAHFAPQMLSGSLASAASPGREKHLRKQLLRDCARQRLGGRPPDFDSYAYPEQKTPVGITFAFDFLTVFFLRMFGRDIVSRWATDLDKFRDIDIESIDPDLFFKYNPLFTEQIAPGMRDQAVDRMKQAGIEAYSADDWTSYEKLRDVLAPFHAVR